MPLRNDKQVVEALAGRKKRGQNRLKPRQPNEKLEFLATLGHVFQCRAPDEPLCKLPTLPKSFC